MGVRRVFDEPKPRRAADRRNVVDRGCDESTDVDDDDTDGLRADRPPERIDIDRHGRRIAIDEARDGAGVDDRRRGGEERIRGHEYFGPRDRAPGLLEAAQDHFERRGAGVDGNRVAGAGDAREFLFESRAERTEGQLPRFEAGVDLIQYPLAVFGREPDARRRDRSRRCQAIYLGHWVLRRRLMPLCRGWAKTTSTL